jgi:filamentous hemagglutinin family protein
MRIVLGAVAPIALAIAPTASAAVHLTSVSAGAATVSQTGSITNIRTANNSILNFSQFDIAAGQTVNFQQPSAASRVLDRINSAAPSMINGSLMSNGSVYLINPAGVIFGNGAMVNVNNFYVAGSHMSDSDFLTGVNHFSGVSGIVSNSGQIHANQAYLIGSQVINQGSIVSPGGVVAMLSGSDVIVGESGSHITATVVPAVSAVPTGGGAKQTDLRMSPMAAGDAYSLAIRHSGSIQASNVVINGGSGAVQVTGSINASSKSAGGAGGSVAITGGYVNLVSATIDASGPAGGGQVLIGGGAHGSGDLAHADYVLLDSGTLINADATANGAGGEIVLWSGQATTSSALLTARGGPLGGNGGYIETSGEYLSVTRAPIASAANGNAGSWVLDPLNIDIIAGADQGTATFTGQATVTNGTIETALQAGSNVLITTNQTGADLGTLSQEQNAPINVTLTSNVTLNLQANSDMTLQGGITTLGGSTGTLAVELDQLNNASSAVTIETSPIGINGPLKIFGGNIAITTAVTATSVQMGSGTGAGGALNSGSISISAPVAASAGGITLTCSGPLAISSTVTTAGGAFASTSAGFSTTAGLISTTGGGVSITSTGADTIEAPITSATTFSASGTTFSLAAGTTTVGSLTTQNGAITISDAGGPVSIGEPVTTTGGGFSVTAATTFSNATTGTMSIAGAVSLVTTGAVTISGPITSSGAFSSTGGTAFDVTAPITTTSGGVTITDSGVDTISGTMTVGGSFSATTDANFTNTAPISVTAGDVTITSTGTIDITAAVNTHGGSFSATGPTFTNTATGVISDNGVNTGNDIFDVNTSSGTSPITISNLTWTGSATKGVTFEGGGTVTLAASSTITTTGGAAVSLYTTGVSTAGAITVGGIINSTGPFISAGGNFTVNPSAGTPAPASITAQYIQLNLPTRTNTPDSKPLTLGTVTVSGPLVATGTGANSGIELGGTVSLILNQSGTLTTNGGAVHIDTAAPITLGVAINTVNSNTAQVGGDVDVNNATSFTSTSTGTIMTGGGAVNITVSGPDGITVGNPINTGGGAVTLTSVTAGGGGVTITNSVNTGGGSFTATGDFFTSSSTLSNGGVSTGAGSFTVDTTGGTGNITINGPINWGGGDSSFMLFQTAGVFTLNTGASIQANPGSGAMKVSIFATGANSSITLDGPVVTTGDLVIDGGTFTTIASTTSTQTTAFLGGRSISINNTATGVVSGHTLTLGSVTITMPAVSTGTSATGGINIGGTLSFIDNQDGALTTMGGAINLTNTGLVALGQPAVTHGGAFTANTGSFTSATAGSITTAGGNVSITTSNTDAINIGQPVNTGGGAFTAVGDGFEDTAAISDGGIGTGANAFVINTTEGTPSATGNIDITNLNVSWTGGVGRFIGIEGAENITVNSITATGSTPLPVTLYTTSTGSATSAITLNGPVTASGAFIASGGSFAINSGGSLTGSTVAINTVNVTPDSHTLSPQGVTLGGSVVSHGAMNISGITVDIQSTGAITTNGGPAQINSTGVVTIEGPINTEGGGVNITSGSTLTSDASGSIVSSGGNVSVASASDMSIGATVSTGGGNFSAAGSTFTNTAQISDGGVGDSKPQGLSISASSGSVSIDGNVSWASSLSPITFTVPSGQVLNLGATITANPAEPIDLSNVTLSANSTTVAAVIAGGNITMGPIVNGTNGSVPELVIQSSGIVSLQTVGTSAAPFGRFIVTNNNTAAVPVTTLNGDIFSLDDVDFAGQVNLPADRRVAISGNGLIAEFDGSIEGPGGLIVSVPGTANSEVLFNGNIGDMTAVSHLKVTMGLNGLLQFHRGTAANPPGVGQQQPTTNIDVASGGFVEFNDNANPLRTYSIIYATIDAYGPVNINIGSPATPNAANMYAVGQNEKFSVYGSLNINTNGGTIITGDISTIGDMNLSASAMEFRLRGPTELADSSGNIVGTVDTGMDLIASGEMTLPSNASITAISGPSVGGSFDVPGFIAQSFNQSSNIGRYASTLNSAYSVVGGISPSALFGPSPSNLLLDLTPNTLTQTIPTFVPPTPFVYDYPLAGAGPRWQETAGTVPLVFKVAFPVAYPGPAEDEQLKEAGIYARQPTIEEILGQAGSMAVYDDMPDRPRPRAYDYQVANNRLDPYRVQAFTAAYHQVFGDNTNARKAQISGDVQAAWDAYVSQSGDNPVSGPGFAEFCARTPSASRANADLEQLHSLRVELSKLGLSYKEAQVAFQYNILSGMSAIGMREGVLAAAVAAAK